MRTLSTDDDHHGNHVSTDRPGKIRQNVFKVTNQASGRGIANTAVPSSCPHVLITSTSLEAVMMAASASDKNAGSIAASVVAEATLADVDLHAFFSDGSQPTSPIKPTSDRASATSAAMLSSSPPMDTDDQDGGAAVCDGHLTGIDLDGFFSDGSLPSSPAKPPSTRIRIAAVRGRAAAAAAAAVASTASPESDSRRPATSSNEYRRLLVLDVVAGRYDAGTGGGSRGELVLRTIDEQRTALVMCHLREDWARSVVKPGDYIHVTGGGDEDAGGDQSATRYGISSAVVMIVIALPASGGSVSK